MTYRLPSLLAALALFSAASGQALQPDPGQKALIERGYGMFIHFGVNTFNQIEWSDGKLPASSFNPTQLDCDQWISTAKEAGFRHVILITKHHDGFCLWDSKFTEYDVASAAVKTDIVAEAAKACKKHGVKLGLYYSLWDRKEPSHNDKDPTKYVGYMKNQLTELLTNYGEICELWFDGSLEKTRWMANAGTKTGREFERSDALRSIASRAVFAAAILASGRRNGTETRWLPSWTMPRR